MKQNFRVASALAGIIFLAGCADNSGGTTQAALAAPVARAAAVRGVARLAPTKRPAKNTAVPKGLEGVGVSGAGITATLPDPKHPGKLLWMIWAKKGIGNLASGQASGDGITALMFKAGHRAAKMTAPHADYDDGRKVIVASGGVAYASLSQPGTWMRARTVTYHADTGEGIARGGVLVHDGKRGGTVSTPTVYFDAGLNTVQSYPLHKGR